MKRIVIELNTRTLFLYEGDALIKSYPVAIGKPSTPTPTGYYHIVNKIMHPGGALGTRWLGLSIPSTGGAYGIHGTSNPSSIGKMISNGCIRMYNHDVEELYAQVGVGTPVQIVGSYQENPVANPGKPGPGGGRVYIVQPGDTLWSIAQRHGISLQVLIQANNLKNPDLLYPGQRIIIP